jgi:exodeoxyribonuclease VII small subunit
MKSNEPSYNEKYKQLEEVIESLQSTDTDLDSAVAKYEKGMSLIADLEKYLKEAENKITKIKAAKSK